MNLAVGFNTMNIGAITINGQTVTQIVPTLNITSVITGIAGTSITKTGAGLLELSGASTFDSGVLLTAGGIEIGASSTPSTAITPATPSGVVTSGPLGQGTFSIGNGTSTAGSLYLVSGGAFTVANVLSVGANNDIHLEGSNGLTLNGALTLNPSANLTVNVDVPGVVLALGGVISDTTGDKIIKNGLGTLALTNVTNAFNGAVTLNQGVLVLAGLNGSSPAPLSGVTPSITISSNGLLALENNGINSNSLITYNGLTIAVNTSSNYAKPVRRRLL